MKGIFWRSITAAAAIILAASAPAQEESVLIIDEEPTVEVRTDRAPEEESSTGQPSTPDADATADGSDEVIALVNTRVMTRAELETRVSAVYDDLLAEVQSRHGGVVATLGDQEGARHAIMAEREILEEQEEEIARAMREEEQVAVQEWVEFALLAEEARRQGIIVTAQEYETRLAEAKRINRIDDEDVETVLEQMRISDEDFERYVYDALLIDKLLQRFIQLNYDREYMRAAYHRNPSVFYEPEKFQIAHFSVVVPEEALENRRELSRLRALAMEVRQRLRNDEDPETIFLEPRYNNAEAGVMGSVPGWFSFRDNMLPAVVEHAGQRMRVGDVSDVLENHVRQDGEVRLRSFHVIEILDQMPELGLTFETALPQIERSLIEIARVQLVQRLRESGRHKVMISMSGIRPDRLPTREELMAREASAEPISLVMPRS